MTGPFVRYMEFDTYAVKAAVTQPHMPQICRRVDHEGIALTAKKT